MKNRITKIAALSLLMSLGACDVDKITSLRDEFQLSISPDAVDNKTEVTIDNYELAGDVPRNITIEFTGENSNLVYSSSGDKTIVFGDDNVVKIGLKKGVNFASEESPIETTAKINAPGFKEETVEFFFTGEALSGRTVFLKSDTYEPVGVEVVNKKIDLVSGKVDSDILIETTSGGTEEEIEVLIPEGAIFEDESGNIISEAFDLEIKTLDPGTDDENEAFTDDDIEDLPILTEEDALSDLLGEDALAARFSMTDGTNPESKINVANTLYLPFNAISFSTPGVFKSSKIVSYRYYLTGKHPVTGADYTVGDEFITVRRVSILRPSGKVRGKRFKTLNKVKKNANNKPYLETSILAGNTTVAHYFKMDKVEAKCDEFRFTYSGVPSESVKFRVHNVFMPGKNIFSNLLYIGGDYFMDGHHLSIIKNMQRKVGFYLEKTTLDNSGRLFPGEEVVIDFNELLTFYKLCKDYHKEKKQWSLVRRYVESIYFLKALSRPEFEFKSYRYHQNTHFGEESTLLSGGRYTYKVNSLETYSDFCGGIELFSEKFKNEIETSTILPSNITVTMPLNINLSADCPKAKVVLANELVYYRDISVPESFYPWGRQKNIWGVFCRTDAQGNIIDEVPELKDNAEYEFMTYYDGKKITPVVKGSEVKSKGINFNISSLCAKIEEAL